MSNNEDLEINKVAYSIKSAQKVLSIGNNSIYDELNSGRLKAKKFGKRTLIPAESLKQWLDSLEDYGAKNRGHKKGLRDTFSTKTM